MQDQSVYLARCEQYSEEAVREAVTKIFAAFGGVASLCGGKKVLLKPNLLLAVEPDDAATTHPIVVQAVAALCIEAGCSVTIADSAGGPYTVGHLKRLYEKTGLDKVAARTGAALSYNTAAHTVSYPEGKTSKSFSIIDPITEADFIIDLAKMKTHGFATYTGAVKNMFGSVPGLTKPVMHSRYPDRDTFCSMLVDLCGCTKPGFSLIDGVVGMEGHGPSGGTPKAAHVLIGAKNPHAADLAAVQIMGLRANQVPTLVEAMRRRLIPTEWKQLTLLGDPIASFQTHFQPAGNVKKGIRERLPSFLLPFVGNLGKPYPEIELDKCIGCGDCMRTCPRKVITIVHGKASIDYSGCIRCYCCHELCRIRAIRFRHRPMRQ